MISFAAPVYTGPQSPQQSPQESPTSARSRRIAILPPPPPPPSSPPVPARSPLRPTPRAPAPVPDAALSKRRHALAELLSSERAYANDLALIRDIHIPLALGQPAPFLTAAASPPPEPPSPRVPPMTREDTRIIFGNVEELAVFSEVFCDKLEEALHGVLDPGGDGQDRVGDLFLSIIPHMKPPYTTYITRHPAAVAHLNALPQTPALTAYLAQTHTLAQSYTHAWDLPSLLIKPVQRLLKYPLLLAAIIDDTEPGGPRDRLREARDKVEEVARAVNEGRRRWELVKDLLDGKHPPPVRLKSIKGLKHRSAGKDEAHLDALEKRLHESEAFIHDFAKDTVDWSAALRDTLAHLERWSATFARVIGLGQPHPSEALELFTEIVAAQITPLYLALAAALHATLLPKLARLLASTAQPLLLLDHMHALRPQHLALLDLPLSKARPPPALLAASQAFLALAAQLRAELPRFLALLARGLAACLAQLADWQARFWREVRAQWVELWDALGVEGDMAAGAADTVQVWWDRWEAVDAAAKRLGIVTPVRDRMSKSASTGSRASASTGSRASTMPTPGPAAVAATAFVAGPAPFTPPPPSAHRRHSMQSIDLAHGLAGSRSYEGLLASPYEGLLASPHPYGLAASASYEGLVASPDSYGSVMSRRESDAMARRESDAMARRENDASHAMARRESDAAMARRESDASHAMAQRESDAAMARRESDASHAMAQRESDASHAMAQRESDASHAMARRESDMPGAWRRDSSDRLPVARRESARNGDRPSTARQGGDRPSTARQGDDRPSTARQGDDRPSTARQDDPPPARPRPRPHPRPGILKKPSADSSASSSFLPLAPGSSSSPRLSVHTSGSSSSSILNHRLSTQSVDAHVGMDMHVLQHARPPSGTSQQHQSAPRAYGSPPVASISDLVSAALLPVLPEPEPDREQDRDRGRMLKKPSMRKRFADAFRAPSRARPSTPTPASAPAPVPVPEHHHRPPSPPFTFPQHEMYACTAVHPFALPGAEPGTLTYRGVPFLALAVGDVLGVLAEEGHPREHAGLPIRPEDEGCEDCLLLARGEGGEVGWALASFLVMGA